MSKLKRMCLMSVAASVLATSMAVAQENNFYSRNKYEAVLDRAQPEFDPEPVRLGAFLVNARGDLGLTATDNVFATPSNRQSDVLARIGASVSGTTNWAVHAVGFDVSAHRNEYLDQSNESNNDLRAGLRGRLDVTREFSLGGGVFAEQRTEPRTDIVNAFGIDAPLEYTVVGARLSADYGNDRVRWNNNAVVLQEDFKNSRQIGTGLPIDQSYRDRTFTEATTRLSYALTPDFAVYGQGSYRISDYRTTQIIGGQARSRDSKGYTAAAGVDFELRSLVRGDIAVGYLKEDKDDAFFADVSGLSIDGRLQWFPTRLTTVSLNAGRSVVDVGAFDSPSALATRGGARVDHELRRNIVVSGFANFANYEYQEIDRKDENVELGLVATYKMNKRVHLDAFYTRLDRDASGAAVFGNPNYDVNQVGIALRVFP
ncbi:outer membrane beta-barrel protein [Hyphomonas sp.]|uniref:outer membrane beta-barrel protein n=1 Tax=Hyphomonas sp. TaxID=87 RepID=UPI003919ECF3